MEESSRELISKHSEADELFIIVPGDEGEIVTYTDDIDQVEDAEVFALPGLVPGDEGFEEGDFISESSVREIFV